MKCGRCGKKIDRGWSGIVWGFLVVCKGCLDYLSNGGRK